MLTKLRAALTHPTLLRRGFMLIVTFLLVALMQSVKLLMKQSNETRDLKALIHAHQQRLTTQ